MQEGKARQRLSKHPSNNKGPADLPSVTAKRRTCSLPGLGTPNLGVLGQSRVNRFRLASMRLILEFWCLLLRGGGVARGEGTEQMGCPVRHLCTRTLWVPESINHHSGILSVGSWKRRSVLQHWVGGVGVGGILPIHSQLGQKGCVPISLKSLHTCWKETRCAFLFLRRERECGCQRVLPRG